MKITLSSASQVERYNALPLVQPILIALVLFLLVFALRAMEIFVPGLAALPDKSIASKLLGLIFVLACLRMLRKPISSIGLHGKNFNQAFLIGGLSMITVYVVLYAIQFYRLNAAGEAPRLIFAVINKETLVMGGLSFTLFHLFGQFVNAFMEESIFRGLMLPQFLRRFRFWQANILQAFLFGLAHLVWPLMSWLRGQVTPAEALSQAAVLLTFTTVGGLIFGYLYYRTNSLWTAVFAHLIDNSAALYFHIQTAKSPNAETDILMLASLGFISLVLLAWIVAKRFNLPTLKPWEAN